MGPWYFTFFIFFLCFFPLALCQHGQKTNLIQEFSDHKAFKQLLRTRTNVMVLFMKHLSESAPIYKVCKEAAQEVKGIGTFVAVDCGKDGKKLCKNLKASPDPHVLHHYKDGKFNKVYDRKEAAKSIALFMNDPTGDVPWEEEPGGKNVVHLGSPGSLDKLLKKNKPVLVMFYAPWCVYCKQMKPQYSAAAVKVKANGDGILAAMDVLRPENIPVQMKYNVTRFPTLVYFKDGKAVKTFDGDKEEEFITFMKDPSAVKPATKETDFFASPDSDVLMLNQDNFEETMQEQKSVLVMFYAPWCGHCKKMKPEYEKAATLMKKENVPGILAAVDSTKETTLSEKFGIKGFPTIKYFREGEFAFNTPQLRDVSKIVEFMRQPKEPPPEPPPEPAWSEIKSEVIHLSDENFKTQLRSKRHALVMFYAPWCGHCKQAKPEFMSAAEKLKDMPSTILAAVDCDEHRALCKFYDVKGYPTFKYFRYLNKESPQDYNLGRSAADFVNFMSQFEEVTSTSESINIKESKPAAKEDEKSVKEKPGVKPVKDNLEKKDTKAEKDEIKWSDIAGGHKVIQLNNENFEKIVSQHSSVVVLFYAPWCAHCNQMKPAYAKAALSIDDKIGVFAACDVSVSEDIADKYLIQGLPTLKYFENGKEKGTFSGDRTTENFILFLKNRGSIKDEL